MFELFEVVRTVEPHRVVILAIALFVAFGFEVVNGFHDTANAVTTVIYSRTLRPLPAVFFSGLCNFLGVLLGGTAIAFSIVHLLPVDLLINATSKSAITMVLALLASGMTWNLSTWWLGLPVSSSHTLIGAILGIGMAHSFIEGHGMLGGVNWDKAGEMGLALLISPVVGFTSAALLLLIAKQTIHDPELYVPPPAEKDRRPPWWIRGLLVTSCGGVSLAHGSNDGQKGMGMIMLILIGLLPTTYALNLRDDSGAQDTEAAARQLKVVLAAHHLAISTDAIQQLDTLIEALDGKHSLREVPVEDRWRVRAAIFHLNHQLETQSPSKVVPFRKELEGPQRELREAIEYVPTWVIVGVALCLGLGTTIGYERVVVTVAEKIGKSHLTYAQGACAELVAMGTIGLADLSGMPVSTTHVLSSGVAGTMWANQSGVQLKTLRSIGLAWVLTLPSAALLSAALFVFGHIVLGS